MEGPGRTPPEEPAHASRRCLGSSTKPASSFRLGALDTVNMAALPDVIHEALLQLSPLAGAASDIEVVRARPEEARGASAGLVDR